jgi:three-Cys-motif partner protein
MLSWDDFRYAKAIAYAGSLRKAAESLGVNIHCCPPPRANRAPTRLSPVRDFWLCDVDENGLRQLRELVDQQPRVRNRTIEVVPGDFNQTVRPLLERSNINENTAAFCLLDQRTFECEWRTLETLAQHKQGNKIELFYFLGTGWLDRAMRATKIDRERIERWWGKPDWPTLIGMPSRQRAELFCKRFREELGYTHAYPFEIYNREVGGRVMYHMIHATDHDAAPKLMNRAYRNATSKREALSRLQRDLSEIWNK